MAGGRFSRFRGWYSHQSGWKQFLVSVGLPIVGLIVLLIVLMFIWLLIQY
jgi:hypothetical protein